MGLPLGENINHVGGGCFPKIFRWGDWLEGVDEFRDSVGREHVLKDLTPFLFIGQAEMKPFFVKQIRALNIVIYAQSGILAGDLAALLSGHNAVDRQTSLPGVLKSLNSQTDVLLLVGGRGQPDLMDPTPILLAAKGAHCKVIMLGEWPDQWNRKLQENYFSSVVSLPKIPSPAVLFELIGGKKELSN